MTSAPPAAPFCVRVASVLLAALAGGRLLPQGEAGADRDGEASGGGATPTAGREADPHRDDREELDQPGLPLGAPRRRDGGEGSRRSAPASRSSSIWLTPPQEDGQIQAQRIAQAVNEGASAILHLLLATPAR